MGPNPIEKPEELVGRNVTVVGQYSSVFSGLEDLETIYDQYLLLCNLYILIDPNPMFVVKKTDKIRYE